MPKTEFSVATDGAPRQLATGMRWVFVVGSVLVTAAAVQLFILTDHTATYFAWTVASGSSACFLGAFYFTALALAAGSARQTEWALARVGVFGVFLFVTLTLIATLRHLSLFHFDGTAIARGAAWLWALIYVIAPIGVALALYQQLRAGGSDRPRERPVPIWYRSAVGVQAAVLGLIGCWLLFASSVAWWPWSLTPLVAQAMASWLLGLALVLATAVWENDWGRIRLAALSYLVLGALQLVAVVRYSADLKGGPSEALYVAALVMILITGATGTLLSAA